MPACIETSHKNKEQTVSHLFHEPLFLKHMLKPAVGGNKTTEEIRSRFKTPPISTITAQNS